MSAFANWLGVIAAVVALQCGAGAADIGAGQRIIAWGTDEITPSYMRQHIEAMEKAPLDGVIFHIVASTTSGPMDFATSFWGTRRFSEEELRPSIEDLRATRFSKLTDNFLRLNVAPGGVDWFDPDFDAVIANARLAAKVVASGRVRGIVFDPEMGPRPVWVYGGQKYHETKSFEEYCKQVRLRGREFMNAIQTEIDAPVIFLTYAWSQVAIDPAPQVQLSGYGLLPAFLDGWLDEARTGAMIVDGFESAYPYREDKDFVKAREAFTKAGETISSAPKAYREHVRLGFGLWMDLGIGSFEWNVDDTNRNKFTPLEFEYAMHRALNHSDGYAWIFCGKPNWWTGAYLPQAYVNAVVNARKNHDAAWKTSREIPGGPDVTCLAAATGALDDAVTFGALWDKYQEVLELPRQGWLFRTDPNRTGETERWYASDVDTASWRPIEIAKFWTEQGYPRFHGVAWYRLLADIPATAKHRQLLLSFGAVDETAVVYVNGQKAGEYGLLGYTWHDRFEIDVTRLLVAGERNVITIRVEDTTGVAGIWKPIKLIAPKR